MSDTDEAMENEQKSDIDYVKAIFQTAEYIGPELLGHFKGNYDKVIQEINASSSEYSSKLVFKFCTVSAFKLLKMNERIGTSIIDSQVLLYRKTFRQRMLVINSPGFWTLLEKADFESIFQKYFTARAVRKQIKEADVKGIGDVEHILLTLCENKIHWLCFHVYIKEKVCCLLNSKGGSGQVKIQVILNLLKVLKQQKEEELKHWNINFDEWLTGPPTTFEYHQQNGNKFIDTCGLHVMLCVRLLYENRLPRFDGKAIELIVRHVQEEIICGRMLPFDSLRNKWSLTYRGHAKSHRLCVS